MKTLWALVLSLVFAATAEAAPVTFAFTGVINESPISGSYTFESTAPLNDIFGRSRSGVSFFDHGIFFDPFPWSSQFRDSYASSITAATVTYANDTGTFDPSFPLGVSDYGASGITVHHASWHPDAYGASIHMQGLAGYDWFGLTIEGQGTVNDTAMPLLPPSLNLAQSARVELFNLSTGAFVQGQLTSLTAVPLPGAVWLMGSALVVLWGWRRLAHP